MIKTIEELRKLNTKRLLALYKAIRAKEILSEFELRKDSTFHRLQNELREHRATIKDELNTRKHIN